MHGADLKDDVTAAARRRGSTRPAARGRERLRAAARRALALLLGCALLVSWLGSARAVCGMTAAGAAGRVAVQHAAHAGMRHAAGHEQDAAMQGSMRGSMQAAMAGHRPVRDAGSGVPGDDGCPMRDQGGTPCPALLHCAAVAAAPVMSGLPRGPDAGRAARAFAHGPLLGESEAAAEPVAPPPRG